METTDKKIRIKIMGREGDREVEVDFEGAVDLCKTALGQGKWLSVVPEVGKKYIVREVEVFTKDLERISADILNAKSLILMSEVRGGGCDAFSYDAEGYDRAGYNVDGYDREGYDAEGYDSDGYDRNGDPREGKPCNNEFKYDSEGYDAEGYDAEGYDRDGFDASGYNRFGIDEAGEPRDNRKTKVVVKVVKDPASDVLVTITKADVVFNNAHGKEAVADALARLSAATESALPELMGGKALVIDKTV